MTSAEEPTQLPTSATGGRRVRRPDRRRAPKLRGALLITALTALLPGSGYVYNGRRVLGGIVIALSVGAAAVVVWLFPRDLHSAVEFAVNPGQLKTFAVVLVVVSLAWAAVLVTTFVMIRPVGVEKWKTISGGAFVGILCLAVAAPVTIAASDAMVTADFVQTVFPEDVKSATTPKHITPEDPWGGRKRVNVLLLGGDGGVHRIGVRHRLDHPGVDRHEDRQGGHLQPAPQHDVRAVPRGKAPCTTCTPTASAARATPAAGCSTPSTARFRCSTRTFWASPTTRAPTPSSWRSRAAPGLRVDYYVLDQSQRLPRAGRRDGRRHGQHQRADRHRRPNRPWRPARPATSSPGRTSTSTAGTRSGTPAADTDRTTTSAWTGSAA